MKAIILVGGQGTRLRPLTYRQPKPLLPILNVPFLVRQLHWLKKHGVEEVTMSLGYLPDAFEEYFSSNPIEGLDVKYVVEDSPLGTAGAIKFAAQGITDDFIVCNGDILTDMDLTALYEFHRENGSYATISLTHVEDPSAFGVVPTHSDGQVIAFVEKPPKDNAPSHWINAGTYILKPRFLDLIPDGIQVSIERETFPTLLQKGKMYAQESDSYWLDIGTPEKYVKAHLDGLENVSNDLLLRDLQHLGEGLFGSPECSLGNNLTIEGNCLIGKGSKIGDNVTMNSVVIGENCVVEDNTSLSQSILHENVRVESKCELELSVVGPGSHIGRDASIKQYTVIGANEKIEPNSQLHSARVPAEV